MMPFQYWKWKCYPMRILLISLTLAFISACGFPGVYKINIEQGNIVTQAGHESASSELHHGHATD
jgi:outer membrane protein assembly factor BamE